MSNFGDFAYLTIQSANRPQNVRAMHEALGSLKPVWYVPTDQVEDYEAEGAQVVGVDGVMPMKPLQLNAALEDGWAKGLITVTMDDDYVRTKELVTDGTKITTRNIELEDFLGHILVEMLLSPYKLGGISPNLNPLWGSQKSTDYGMITGQVMFHKPSHVKFDTAMPMMEDLEIVIRHHSEFGGVVKNRRYLQEFHMMGRNEKSDLTHTGGYAGLRNEERLAKAVAILQYKYQDEDVIIENNGLGNSSHSKVNFKKLAEKKRQ